MVSGSHADKDFNTGMLRIIRAPTILRRLSCSTVTTPKSGNSPKASSIRRKNRLPGGNLDGKKCEVIVGGRPYPSTKGNKPMLLKVLSMSAFLMLLSQKYSILFSA